jgi:hypothetical protein
MRAWYRRAPAILLLGIALTGCDAGNPSSPRPGKEAPEAPLPGPNAARVTVEVKGMT